MPLTNVPRDYAWGSTTLLAELEGRVPTGAPEAEVWFGDHEGWPARVPGGASLAEWLRTADLPPGTPRALPYLVKILAAGAPLSIQAHPSKAQAAAGFAREEASEIARDHPARTYRDDNHKPEIIVALSESFRALAGLRDIGATLRLLSLVGPAAAPLRDILTAADSATACRDAIAWALDENSRDEVSALIEAAAATVSEEFAAECELVRHLASHYPGDPGIVVALLLNLVELSRGQAIFVPAGVLHAYISGLGVEIMAASDNVLRGGLTPKHIDVDELLEVLDSRPGPAPVLDPPHGAVRRFAGDVPDFVLTQITPGDGSVDVPLAGIAIAVAGPGEVDVGGRASEHSVRLRAGQAVLITPDEQAIRVSGAGELYLAEPGSSGGEGPTRREIRHEGSPGA